MVEADVTVEVERPTAGTGNILVVQKLGAAGTLDGDAVDARANTLMALERAQDSPLVTMTQKVFPLYDDGTHDDGGLEADGVYGNPIAGLTRFEGNYTFHAMATYGEGCTARREITWTAYVSVGIDPDNTSVKTETISTDADGRERIRVTVTPWDRHGNYVGPGRGDSFTLGGVTGSEPVGGLTDNGDGSYTGVILWDPGSGERPGVSLGQPGRPPAVVTTPEPRFFQYVVKFVCGRVEAAPCCCDSPVRPGVYETEINIFNPNLADARIRKVVTPIVLAGAVIGREPRVATAKAVDKIALPPLIATMDDCHRILELLLGAPPAQPVPLTIGMLEILSTVELAVTAVYTMSAPERGAVAVDVEQIRARRV